MGVFFSQQMLRIAVELALNYPVYEEFVVKFFEHTMWIAGAYYGDTFKIESPNVEEKGVKLGMGEKAVEVAVVAAVTK